MNDIATIERALKDADQWIEIMVNGTDPSGSLAVAVPVRDQITDALMLLRQIPGQHSPTTATRQAIVALQREVTDEIEWAAQRWRDEVANRPLQNKHRRTLDDTWRQVIRHFGGDDIALCGPRHDDLVR